METVNFIVSDVASCHEEPQALFIKTLQMTAQILMFIWLSLAQGFVKDLARTFWDCEDRSMGLLTCTEPFGQRNTVG
jgi:hypothetical protein